MTEFKESIIRMGDTFENFGILEMSPEEVPVSGFIVDGQPLQSVTQLRKLIEKSQD